MKRLTVLIEGQSKELELDGPFLMVKKAIVFLNYNITSSAASDLEIIYNNIKKTIKEGYWTFNMLKKRDWKLWKCNRSK